MDDLDYRKALIANRTEQTRQALERRTVIAQMQKLIDETRTTLPEADRTNDVVVRAALEKRPEWTALEEENTRKIGDIEKTLAAARETVRQRMEAEARDAKAVAEGRAVPAERPPDAPRGGRRL
jgi:hypothetical protein